MKRVIKTSKVWIAAFAIGLLLTGCGGGSSSGNSTSGSASGGDKSASLSWNAPATRVNGEGLAMGELQGYIIRYGQDANNLSESIEINEASTMDYTITNLNHGNWYFTIQVVDVDGLTSAPSEVVSKTI